MNFKLFFLVLFLSFGLLVLPSTTLALSPMACTQQYEPVCGAKQVQCVTTPCYPVYETYGNSCMLGLDKNAYFIHEGECTEGETGPVIPPEPYVPPKGCIAWFDGCNQCSMGDGGAMCTLMACTGKPQAGYCTAYEKPTPPPVVTTTPPAEEPSATTTETAPVEEPGFFTSVWILISSWFASLFFWL